MDGRNGRKYWILAFSEEGMRLAERVSESLDLAGIPAEAARSGRPLKASEWAKEHFQRENCLLFVGACGIAVRSIAPLLRSKLEDPAVLVMDEAGRFVIPLLSGHLGGANEEAVRVAGMVGGQAVLTTGTDVRGRFAVDTWASSQGLTVLEPWRIVNVSGRVLDDPNGITIATRWKIEGALPKGIGEVGLIDVADAAGGIDSASEIDATDAAGGARMDGNHEVYEVQEDHQDHDEGRGSHREISSNRRRADVIVDVRAFDDEPALHLVPRALVLGIGCRKGAAADAIEDCWSAFSEKNGIPECALSMAASIDVKKDEPGIIEFCRRRGIPFRTFASRELNAIEGEFHGSDFVKKTVGTDSVCERSAVLAAGREECGSDGVAVSKFSRSGVTMAAAIADVKLSW